MEYEDTYYKVYDWDGKLCGYFFPHYKDGDSEGEHDELVEQLNKDHAQLDEGTLLVPMLRLDLLDSETAIPVGQVVSSLESGKARAVKWNEWLSQNAPTFSIRAAGAHTAREDRNMLSIAMGLQGKIILDEKELAPLLRPLLDKLHADGLL